MATTTTKTSTKSGTKDASENLQKFIDGLQANEKSALDAIKKFVDTVNDVFPDFGEEGPRSKIIDAAFSMTQQIVESSNKMAKDLVGVTEDTLDNIARSN
ncbi:MAG: hypothetical protein IT194_03525 [Microthrixaceae bacterium]|nr:hypothetical protein [Microthrixaceae bacterium]